MKPLGPEYAKRLRVIATRVKVRLNEASLDTNLETMTEAPWRTDTYGWACPIARLTGAGRSDFELWLDQFPNVGKPVLSVSFWAANRERVIQVASAHRGRRVTTSDLGNDLLLPRDVQGDQRMRAPLAAKYFNTPVVEFYDSNFVTIYLRSTSTSVSAQVESCVRWLKPLVGAAVGALLKAPKFEDYPRVTERKLVRRHATWERSPSIAREAKLRDGFICQICDFNFSSMYGKLGRGFAEAHHKKPLSSLRAKSALNSAADLVTVCANCHRMLHRLKGNSGDVEELQQTVRDNRHAR